MDQQSLFKQQQMQGIQAGNPAMQQEQQANPYLQKVMMDQQLQEQQSKGNLQKAHKTVQKNMPKNLQKKEEKKGKAATPFSPEIQRQLEVIIRDKENASSYYQPILRLSRAMLKTDLTEDTKVALFRELMESMTFYLNHCAETESASLSERRRNLCRRTIKGSMLFVAQAPPEYNTALKEGLQKLSGTERNSITKMQSEELKRGFLDYLAEATGEKEEEDPEDKKS